MEITGLILSNEYVVLWILVFYIFEKNSHNFI